MAVVSTATNLALHAAPTSALCRRRCRSVVASAVRFDRRSAVLLLLSAAGAAPAASPASAAGIGLFGIRKKLERAEEAAAEAVREVEEAAVEAAEVGGKAVKETVEAAEKEVTGEGLQLLAGTELAGDGLVQAGVVAGAEALGVVVGLSVVNGILRPEA
ncbi:hypothetical protein ABZP36_032186 [Zizania latifolia]